jgi:hypothetical protein
MLMGRACLEIWVLKAGDGRASYSILFKPRRGIVAKREELSQRASPVEYLVGEGDENAAEGETSLTKN